MGCQGALKWRAVGLLSRGCEQGVFGWISKEIGLHFEGERSHPPAPRHDGIPTGKIPMRRASPAPRRPHVAPSEVLLGKGLPLRSCTSASRARGAYKLKRLGPHSPITGFHYRSDQPRRRRTDPQRTSRQAFHPVRRGSASRARGAYKLKRLGPHSPITGFSLPGIPAHPASPHLSPRLRQSARTW